MTPEELLRPRYKVIADFPYNDRKVGSVINCSTHNPYPQQHLDKYRNIYKKLEWWEDREEKDMPKYVKNVNKGHGGVFKAIFYMEETSAFFMFLEERSIHPYHPDEKHWLPATKEEYDNYKTLNP